ncbi:MAG: F-type +-transporting ATPase subunit epsilon [Candidatus Peribacteria bacterium]|nr:F-type +-transporting ATPase subunit epsilon [Candidatus Peribacteria bacterium]
MFHLEIITPEKVVYEGDVDAVTLPTGDGEIVVLSMHVPLITSVMPGTLIVREQGREHAFAVSRGVIEVDGQRARVLTDIADAANELDEEAIQKAKADAEKLMSEKRLDIEGYTEALAVLNRELARLKTVRRHRSRRSFTSSDS